MKVNIIILLLILSSKAVGEYLFESGDDIKNIDVRYNGNSTLVLSHNFDLLCKGRKVPSDIYENYCKYEIEDAILVTLNYSGSYSPVIIDMYDADGASPIITNILTLDLDSDGSNELYIQVYNRHRHAEPGASADIEELFAYGSVIERQEGTGTDFKRLYYLEEEYETLLNNKESYLESSLNGEVLKRNLLDIKKKNFTSNYLNKRGEIWYKKKNNYAKSSVYWYQKKYSFGYNVAISYFEAAVKKNPKYVPVLSNLGIVYQKVGLYEEAISAAEKAIQLTDDPNIKASSHYNIAKAYEENRNWLPALENYKKAKSYRKHSAYEKGINRVMGIMKKNENKN